MPPFSSPDPPLPATVNEPGWQALLFVDDEQSYVNLVTQLLGDSLQCPIVTYTKPQKVLDALPRLDLGMIITDYSMPGMNGLEFIRRVGELAPHLPVIMITGHAVEMAADELSRFPNLKATLYKPFSWRLLTGEIVRHWPGPNSPLLPGDGFPA